MWEPWDSRLFEDLGFGCRIFYDDFAPDVVVLLGKLLRFLQGRSKFLDQFRVVLDHFFGREILIDRKIWNRFGKWPVDAFQTGLTYKTIE